MFRTLLVVLFTLTFPVVAETMSLGFEADGDAVFENRLMRLRVTPQPGRAEGVRGWFFKPTGYEMVDVLYRQLDAEGGHLLGFVWDGTEVGDLPRGGPAYGRLFIPRVAAIDKAGRGGLLVQVAEAEYRLTRTLLFRQDLAMLEVHLKLENLTGKPVGTALRLHNVASPGARGQYQAGNDVLFMQLEQGLAAWDQSLPLDTFLKQYGGDSCLVADYTSAPRNMWTDRGKSSPRLIDSSAALVNPDNGDGLLFLADPASLLGVYNCPNITLEPFFRGFALDHGETWETRVYIGAFSGAKGKQIVGSSPLYVVTRALNHVDGRLQGELIPLWQGSLRVGGQTWPANPEQAIQLQAEAPGDWAIVALDTAGKELGRVTADGSVHLYMPEVETTPPSRPVVSGQLHQPDRERVAAFVAARDYVIQCDHTSSEPVRKLARSMALKLGVGYAETPLYDGKMIAFGCPARSTVVRNAGLLKWSIDAEWPGAGKGAILHYANFESTTEPLVLVGGSDPQGALAAAQAFHDAYVRDAEPATGWDLWAAPLSVHARTWVRPSTSPSLEKISLTSARNEYESAQVVLTAYERLSDIRAELAPLIHVESGEELGRGALNWGRKTTPNPRLRWAEPFPLYPVDGWPGTPDALLDRPVTNLDPGESKVLWITVLSHLKAAPGLYRSTLTVSANGQTRRLPVELEIHDFELPLTGIKGEAYMAMHLMAMDGHTSPFHVDRLVRTLVEHRFRILHLGEPGMIRIHVSEAGEFKDFGTATMISSEDGKVMLDVSRLDWLIQRCDQAGQPFQLEYVISLYHIVGWPQGIHDFTQATPDRYADRPERGGHKMQSWHAQELCELFKRYLDQRDLYDRVLVKVGDEPPGFDHWYHEFATAVREAGLRYGTAFNAVDWKQAEKALGSKWSQIQPLYQRFDADFARQAQAAGHEVGWYNCGPPPRIGIGVDAAELRAYYWQAARYDLDFVARWGIQCWGTEGNTPTNMWTFKYAHHNSVLYNTHPTKPPYRVEGRGWVDTPPLDSIRFELIRDGIEDADYVGVLRERIAAAREAGREDAADQAQAVLDRIWSGTFPSLNHYNPPYTTIEACREQVARAILHLKQEPLP